MSLQKVTLPRGECDSYVTAQGNVNFMFRRGTLRFPARECDVSATIIECTLYRETECITLEQPMVVSPNRRKIIHVLP